MGKIIYIVINIIITGLLCFCWYKAGMRKGNELMLKKVAIIVNDAIKIKSESKGK
jgi:hypothetical protein